MSDTKISALTGATTPLAGTEVLPIVQSGATVKVSVANLTAGRVVSATQLTSTVAIGTAPLVVTSTTNVANLNASSLSGATFAAPGAIGGGTAAAANFTSIGSTLGSNFATTSGNVGVGTATPVTVKSAVTLQVLGNAKLGNDSGAGLLALGDIAGVGSNAGIWRGAAGAYAGVGNWLNLGGYSGITFTTGAADISAQTERMRIDDTGIVTMSAYGAGAATFSAAGVISSVSDENWKIKDGVPTNPTEMLGKLQPGYWYYNDKHKDTFGVDRQLGFYAQNVNAAIGPEAAPEPESFKVTDDQGVETLQQKPWGYYDRSVLAVVVMALQESLATVKALEVRIQALEGKI